MKDKTRFYLARLMIMMEKEISNIDQSISSGGINKYEEIGLRAEKSELLDNYYELKKCHNWVASLND